MKTSFVRDVRARDVRDIHPSIHRFVVRAGGPSVPSFARHRPHRSRERHRETNERTNRTNRSEANRIHDRPVPRFEIRDSRFEIRDSSVESRASRFERRASRSPSTASRAPPRAHPPTRAHRPRVEIRDSHRRHHHSKSSFKIITHAHPASNRTHPARLPPHPPSPTPVARAPPHTSPHTPPLVARAP